MFGWFKKNAISEMKNIIYLAQLTSYFSILEILCLESNTNHEEHENPEAIKNSKFAAAVTNYLFAKGIAEQHKKEFTVSEIESWANNWLDSKSDLCELVIQCLRSLNTIQQAENKNITALIGEAYLIKYGPQYPAKPDANLLKTLISRINSLLPSDLKSTIDSEAKRLNIRLI